MCIPMVYDVTCLPDRLMLNSYAYKDELMVISDKIIGSWLFGCSQRVYLVISALWNDQSTDVYHFTLSLGNDVPYNYSLFPI